MDGWINEYMEEWMDGTIYLSANMVELSKYCQPKTENKIINQIQ